MVQTWQAVITILGQVWTILNILLILTLIGLPTEEVGTTLPGKNVLGTKGNLINDIGKKTVLKYTITEISAIPETTENKTNGGLEIFEGAHQH
jgi:hypothetical protein